MAWTPSSLEVMEIDLTPEQEARLCSLADAQGTNAEELMKAAALRILEANARFLAAVEEGIASADRGEWISHEEVVARMERWFAAG